MNIKAFSFSQRQGVTAQSWLGWNAPGRQTRLTLNSEVPLPLLLPETEDVHSQTAEHQTPHWNDLGEKNKEPRCKGTGIASHVCTAHLSPVLSQGIRVPG